MYKRFYYFILSFYIYNSERKYNCSIHRYRRFYCKNHYFSMTWFCYRRYISFYESSILALRSIQSHT